MLQGRKEILVDRVDFAIEGLLSHLVRRKAGPLFAWVGQFTERVGKFEAANIELEPFGKAGILGLAAGQRRHAYWVVVQNRRRAEAEPRLYPLQENAEKQGLPIIPGMIGRPCFSAFSWSG